MEYADIVISGNWVLYKFTDLGPTTSTIDLSEHRGFNVLGLKKGATTLDDWYVVGEHYN